MTKPSTVTSSPPPPPRERRPSEAGGAAGFTGLALILQAAAAFILLRADDERVYFLGRPLVWVCAMKSRLHLPCPTCGMTRSLVLSLHGEVGRAWRIAPGGPVFLFGVLALAAALIALSVFGEASRRELAKSWLRRSAVVYAGFATMVWLAGWAVSFAAAWRARG
jgi:hypothetical protein